MIYLRYVAAEGASVCHEAEGRHCRELLEEGLLCEAGIRFAGETVAHNRWGKPCLSGRPGIHFNLSHCKGLAACIIGSSPVGIDAEYVRAYNPLAARRACTGEEIHGIETATDPDRQFFRLWSLKECFVKALGMGLAFPLKQAAFTLTGNEAVCPNQPGWTFALREDSGGFVLAACARAESANDLLLSGGSHVGFH